VEVDNLILKTSVTIAVLVFNFGIAMAIMRMSFFRTEKLEKCSVKC